MAYPIRTIISDGYNVDNTQYMGLRIPYGYCGDNLDSLRCGIWAYPQGYHRPHSSLDVTVVHDHTPLYPTADELRIDPASISRQYELDTISRRQGWYTYPEFAPLREESRAIHAKWVYLARRWIAWRRRRQAIAVWERIWADKE